MLREGLQRLAGWRLKAMGGWRRPKTLVIDIDSLPVEVHGEQPGSAWNGYYHRRVYHPIVASAGETGDILDLRLREGQVHTADGGLEFVLEVLERAERHLCGKAAVRFDAGYPGEPLMAALEERGTHYVARVRNCCDMWRSYVNAVRARAPQALIVFDKFHIVSHLGKAVDEVRREEIREKGQAHKDLVKNSRYLWLKNPWNLTGGQAERLATLVKLNTEVHRAYLLKEMFRRFWEYKRPRSLRARKFCAI